MEKKVIYEIRELSKFNGLFSVYDNLLGVADIDSFSMNEGSKTTQYYLPDRTHKIGMIWILEGECILQIDNTPYRLSGHSFLLVPSWGAVYISSVSEDFKAKMLIADKRFMDECITNKQILSFFNCLFVKRMLQTSLEEEDICLLNTNFDSLRDKIKISSHAYYKEIIPVNFMSFLLDVSHILNKTKENNISTPSTRKEEIFNKFLDLLLEHYKEQHEVAFYADKLFITPQYLTLIIKELTGKTTNKWIDDTLILEARKLLKTTQTTVQQIADLLNFSDQSTFGKFFKKYHGISPAEYRKMYFTSLSIA